MEFFESVLRKYSGLIIAGFLGSFIRRIREKMSLTEFVQVIILGVFVSYCVGVSVDEYMHVPEHLRYVIGATSAIYSKEILDEIKEVISSLADTVKSWLSKKID